MKLGAFVSAVAPAVAVASVLAWSCPASADLAHYVYIEGALQGTIQGDSTFAGKEGLIPAYALHHLVEKPNTGSPSEHQTVISTFDLGDRSIPQLMNAMITDESLLVRFQMYRPGGGGNEVYYMRITLTGARIVSVEPLSPSTLDPDLAADPATVRVRFDYSAIQFENLPAGTGSVLMN